MAYLGEDGSGQGTGPSGLTRPVATSYNNHIVLHATGLDHVAINNIAGPAVDCADMAKRQQHQELRIQAH